MEYENCEIWLNLLTEYEICEYICNNHARINNLLEIPDPIITTIYGYYTESQNNLSNEEIECLSESAETGVAQDWMANSIANRNKQAYMMIQTSITCTNP